MTQATDTPDAPLAARPRGSSQAAERRSLNAWLAKRELAITARDRARADLAKPKRREA